MVTTKTEKEVGILKLMLEMLIFISRKVNNGWQTEKREAFGFLSANKRLFVKRAIQ